jgi:hypothetical protein
MVQKRNIPARKWDARGALGVFAGYRLHPGYIWRGEYLVWELDSFQHSDLRTVATNHHQRVGIPHVTKVCSLPVEGLIFPLKKDYDRVNMELVDPRIVNEDYELHEEAAKVRGYIPEIGEDVSRKMDEGFQDEAGYARNIVYGSTPESLLDDGRSLGKEVVGSHELLPEIPLDDGRSLGEEERAEVLDAEMLVGQDVTRENNPG